ncbi:hypothetical protein I317_05292 [Kwoniella heveanensis CBS 569]|nr:hypothetical protein I317_05292 [Kwoniella heveanensis CBS 569]
MGSTCKHEVTQFLAAVRLLKSTARTVLASPVPEATGRSQRGPAAAELGNDQYYIDPSGMTRQQRDAFVARHAKSISDDLRALLGRILDPDLSYRVLEEIRREVDDLTAFYDMLDEDEWDSD